MSSYDHNMLSTRTLFTAADVTEIQQALAKFVHAHTGHDNQIAQFINDLDDDKEDFKRRTMPELGLDRIYEVDDQDGEFEEFQEREEGDNRIDLLDERGYQIVLNCRPSEFFLRLSKKIKDGADPELTASVRDLLVHRKYLKQKAHAASVFAAVASLLAAEGAIVESHVAEAVSMDDLVARAKAVVTKAARSGTKAVEKAAKSALALASRNKKNIFYALLVAAFYVYAFAPFFVGRPKRTSTVDGVGGVWAKDPATLKRAKAIFDEIAKRKADVSPAIYTEIRKAGNIVGKGLAVV